MVALNLSLPEDRRLWRQDLTGSRAWARGLERAGVLGPGELAELLGGLDAVEASLADGFPADAPDEDIHSLVERLLVEEVGDVGRKLHTGRSRNDQVSTDLRLWGLGAAKEIEGMLLDLASAILRFAGRFVDVVVPSYTHLQPAQPVRAAHWALSHLWPLLRDVERLRGAAKRASVLPLGCGAVAGCPFPVDREALRRELGFLELAPNSIDAVRDRDWVLDMTYAGATVGVHLSSLAEDMIILASREFGWLRLPDGYTTGSSLMPQKRNPDVAELVRGKAGRLVGNLVALLTLLKGLPTAYNRDLQEEKGRLFDTVDTLFLVLPALTGAVAGSRIDEGRARGALEPALLATDLADYLVRRGVPFRTAHEAVGRVVRRAEERGVALPELSVEEYREAHPAFEADLQDTFSWERSVEARQEPGGTSRHAVEAQMAEAGSRIQRWRARDAPGRPRT